MNRRPMQEGRNSVNEELTKGKKRAEAEWLKAVVDAMADAMVVIWVDGIVISVNPALIKMLGYKAEELVGANAAEVIPKVMGPKAMEKAMEIMKDVFEKGIVGTVEIIVKAKDGREIPVSAAFSPIKDAMGNITSMVVTLRDITESKRVEEKIRIFSDAIENAYDGVVLTDLDGNITYANESALKIFGYTTNEITKLNVANFVPDPKHTENIIIQMKKKGKWSGELISVRNNKEKFPGILSASIVKNEEGKTLGMMGVFRDITELKKADEERIKAAANKKRMEELEKFAKIAVGRELRMVELKERIKELEEQLEKK